MSKILIDTDDLSVKASEDCPVEMAKAIVMLESLLSGKYNATRGDIEVYKSIGAIELIN